MPRESSRPSAKHLVPNNMFKKLVGLFSPRREKTTDHHSTKTSIDSSVSSESLNNIRPLNYPVRTPQQAPPAKGEDLIWTYIDGDWDSSAQARLVAVQTKAHEQANKHRSPVADRKPYSIIPGGHEETVACVSRPNNPETLARLFAVRDEAARRKNARFVQGFNLSRALPDPQNAAGKDAGQEGTDSAPRLPKFNKVSNGFVPLTTLVAEEVSLAIPTVTDVDRVHEDDIFSDSQDTGGRNTESASLCTVADDEGKAVEGDSADMPEDDSASMVSSWSSSSSDSSSCYSSDSEDSFERWATGEDQANDDDHGNEDTVTSAHDLAERRYRARKKAAGQAAQRAVLPPPGSTLSEIDAFAQAWSENATTPHQPDPVPPPSAPAPQSPGLPNVPLIRRDGKYLYSTTAADRRFDYIKSYLHLREEIKPISILLLLVHYRPKAACSAARRNPAFLRAAQDIDWTGILDEMPTAGHGNDSTRIYNRHVIKTWFKYGGGHVFAGTDRDGDTVFLQEDEDDAELSWPALMAREDVKKREKEIRDRIVLERVYELDSTRPSRRRRWKTPGRSNLGWTLTAPV
jgi:hypothetical protein